MYEVLVGELTAHPQQETVEAAMTAAAKLAEGDVNKVALVRVAGSKEAVIVLNDGFVYLAAEPESAQ